MTKVISDKKELKKLSLEEKIENVKNGLRNNSILCEKYIKNNATLLESFRQIVNLPNVRNLGELFWLLGEVGERGYKPLAKMEDFDFERLVFKKKTTI